MSETVVLMPKAFTVTVGDVDTTAQISEATIAFDTQTATVRTLGGEAELATGERGTLTLAGYQDWQLPEALSICWALWNANGRTAQFVIEAQTEDGAEVTASGQFQARRPGFGPTADDAAQFSLDMPLLGIPDIMTTPAGGALARSE